MNTIKASTEETKAEPLTRRDSTPMLKRALHTPERGSSDEHKTSAVTHKCQQIGAAMTIASDSYKAKLQELLDGAVMSKFATSLECQAYRAAVQDCIDLMTYLDGCGDTLSGDVIVALKRPEGYEGVAAELVAEDALRKTAFEWELLTSPTATLVEAPKE